MLQAPTRALWQVPSQPPVHLCHPPKCGPWESELDEVDGEAHPHRVLQDGPISRGIDQRQHHSDARAGPVMRRTIVTPSSDKDGFVARIISKDF
jgi:hypothetical protein